MGGMISQAFSIDRKFFNNHTLEFAMDQASLELHNDMDSSNSTARHHIDKEFL